MRRNNGGAETDRLALLYLVTNRRARRLPYLLLCLAALCSVFVSSPASVSHQMHPVAHVVFSVVFITSAFMCFIGAATDLWAWEYMGLIPLYGSFVTFGVAIIGYGFVTGWQVLPAGLSLLGFGLLFRARWKDITFLYDYVAAHSESE